VARDLVARGHRVTGLDASATLLRAAAQADPASRYVEGAAEALPFDDGAFDLVVAYNSLMDVTDMAAAVREAARVLAPGGRLCACVTHPLPDAGSWRDDETYAVTESYLEQRWFSATMERAGLEFTFEGWGLPLEAYAGALEAAGLLIEAMREPADPRGRALGARADVPHVARRQGALAASRPGLAIRTWTWSSWWASATTTPRGPRRCRWGPTKSLTAPAARKRSTRSWASTRSTSAGLRGASSARSRRGYITSASRPFWWELWPSPP
jgi:SAM-dependent methyltransferase